MHWARLMFRRFLSSGQTPEYPDYNWIVRGDVDLVYGKGTIEKIREALVSLDDVDLLNSFLCKRFIPADNSLYQPILDTGRVLGIFR